MQVYNLDIQVEFADDALIRAFKPIPLTANMFHVEPSFIDHLLPIHIIFINHTYSMVFKQLPGGLFDLFLGVQLLKSRTQKLVVKRCVILFIEGFFDFLERVFGLGRIGIFLCLWLIPIIHLIRTYINHPYNAFLDDIK